MGAAGIIGDELKETGAGGVRGRGKGDVDGTRSFGGDAGAAGIGLREIASSGDLANGGRGGSVVGDGGRERRAGGTNDLIGEGQGRGVEGERRGTSEFVGAHVDGGGAEPFAVEDAVVAGNVLGGEIGSGVGARIDGGGSGLEMEVGCGIDEEGIGGDVAVVAGR